MPASRNRASWHLAQTHAVQELGPRIHGEPQRRAPRLNSVCSSQQATKSGCSRSTVWASGGDSGSSISSFGVADVSSCESSPVPCGSSRTCSEDCPAYTRDHSAYSGRRFAGRSQRRSDPWVIGNSRATGTPRRVTVYSSPDSTPRMITALSLRNSRWPMVFTQPM